MFSRVGRSEFFKAFFSYEKACWKRVGTDKQSNYLPAVHSVPGGGKSFICDQLASPDESMLQLIEDDDIRDVVADKTFALPITFNYHSTWDGLESGVSAKNELVIRFLHS